MAKYYCVWRGRTPGVYDSWAACQQQITGFGGAEFKSFKTKQQANEAFTLGSGDFLGKSIHESELSPEEISLIGPPIEDSIVVDAAWNTSTGDIEFQGIDFKTKKQLFHRGPLPNGTNNVGEFLAIVLALAYCQQHQLTTPIYSDSRNAINWVKDKQVRTNLVPTELNKQVFAAIDKALEWLRTNIYLNRILKWETKAWGENPADFGRK